jgi:hypothetical protein
MVELSLQIAAHGLDVAVGELFSVLFTGPYCDNLVAIKSFTKIFDPKSKFLKSAYFLKLSEEEADKHSIEGTIKLTSWVEEEEKPPSIKLVKDSTNILKDFFNKQLKIPLSNLLNDIDFSALLSEERVGVDTYITTEDNLFISFEVGSHQLENSLKDKFLQAALQRVSKVMTKSKAER